MTEKVRNRRTCIRTRTSVINIVVHYSPAITLLKMFERSLEV